MLRRTWSFWTIFIAVAGVLTFVDIKGKEIQSKSIEVFYTLGDYGESVTNLQERLSGCGYYNYNINGMYDKNTYNSVKALQKDNGISESGSVDNETLKFIGLNKDFKASEEEVSLLGKYIYLEAGNEPYETQTAVGAVIINRVKDENFPNTLSEVIFQVKSYSEILKVQADRLAYRAALSALRGNDPTGNSLYYRDVTKLTSVLIDNNKENIQIGSFVFENR